MRGAIDWSVTGEFALKKKKNFTLKIAVTNENIIKQTKEKTTKLITSNNCYYRVGFESETDTEEFEKIGQGGADSKVNSYDEAKQKLQKQLEVGGDDGSRSVSPSSSTSTNVSSLTSRVVDFNRSSSSSEPGGSFNFPSPSTSERPAPLSPLTECPENSENSNGVSINNHRHHRFTTTGSITNYSRVDIIDRPSRSSPTSDEARSLSPLPASHSRSVACDGQLLQQQHHQQQQQQQQQRHHQANGSGGSSPSVEPGNNDFLGTEFYMDESLPSSLSEHPNDGQHQAIVSLLQVLGRITGSLTELVVVAVKRSITFVTYLRYFFFSSFLFFISFSYWVFFSYPFFSATLKLATRIHRRFSLTS